MKKYEYKSLNINTFIYKQANCFVVIVKIITFARYETIQTIRVRREYAIHLSVGSNIPYSVYECAVDVRAYRQLQQRNHIVG